jgi:hypothetical protein
MPLAPLPGVIAFDSESAKEKSALFECAGRRLPVNFTYSCTVCADRNNGNDRGGARGGRARRALLAKRGGDREYGGNWGIPSSSSSSDEGEGEDAEGIGGDLGVGDSSGATCSQRVRGGPRVYRICAASRDPFLLNELRFLFFGLLSCTLVLAKPAAPATGSWLTGGHPPRHQQLLPLAFCTDAPAQAAMMQQQLLLLVEYSGGMQSEECGMYSKN